MSVQTIKAADGREYVLLPVAVYRALRDEIEDELEALKTGKGKAEDYEPFVLEDYVDNPVALARIRAGLTQAELAAALGVSQPYIAKLEAQERVTPQVMAKVQAALKARRPRKRAAG